MNQFSYTSAPLFGPKVFLEVKLREKQYAWKCDWDQADVATSLPKEIIFTESESRVVTKVKINEHCSSQSEISQCHFQKCHNVSVATICSCTVERFIDFVCEW